MLDVWSAKHCFIPARRLDSLSLKDAASPDTQTNPQNINRILHSLIFCRLQSSTMAAIEPANLQGRQVFPSAIPGLTGIGRTLSAETHAVFADPF
jgi:hypothetical protein